MQPQKSNTAQTSQSLITDFQATSRPSSIRRFWSVPISWFAPRSKEPNIRSREVVLNVLLAVTSSILALAVIMLLISGTSFHNTYVLSRAIWVGGALLMVIGIYILSRKRQYTLAASALLAVYFLLATGMVYVWGTNVPMGILLYGLVVVLGGILLGARYSLFAAAAVIVVLGALQVATHRGLIHPDRYWATKPANIADIIGFCLVFSVAAVASWLFNRQLEQSLQRALRAEAGLLRQKALLEIKVEERTRELQAAQLDKMQQLHRFAQLGQFSAALLHDLANHLTTLTLDIEEGLEGGRHSRLLQRAKRRIKYIDDMVQWAHDHLHGKSRPAYFNIINEIDEVIKILQPKSERLEVGVRLEESSRRVVRCYGDPTQFRQMIANIISNGIDAYEPISTEEKPREVLVTVKQSANSITIMVADWGKGIAGADHDKIFEPFYSTKGNSMGIGLFIARQIVEDYFKGSVTVESSRGRTLFRIKLAKIKP